MSVLLFIARLLRVDIRVLVCQVTKGTTLHPEQYISDRMYVHGVGQFMLIV